MNVIIRFMMGVVRLSWILRMTCGHTFLYAQDVLVLLGREARISSLIRWLEYG